MYWCARISKPVGTPDIAHDQIRRCPCGVSVQPCIGERVRDVCVCVHAFTPRHVRTGFAASPQTTCLRFFQTGLKSKSFYLSERAELSNKRLSFSATSVSFHSLPIRESFLVLVPLASPPLATRIAKILQLCANDAIFFFFFF